MANRSKYPRYKNGMVVKFKKADKLHTGTINFVSVGFILVLCEEFERPHREVVVQMEDVMGEVNEYCKR